MKTNKELNVSSILILMKFIIIHSIVYSIMLWNMELKEFEGMLVYHLRAFLVYGTYVLIRYLIIKHYKP